MGNLVILGAQWGDEGKGKIVDMLAGRFGAVVRFQGGANAGHTVVVDGSEIVLHQIPSGILGDVPYCVIGNGTVVDPVDLVNEIGELHARDIEPNGRFFISSRAPLVVQYHRDLDRWSEELRGGKRIGTTGRGIGPAYMDKVGREGLRVGDLRVPELLREKLAWRIERVNVLAERVYNQAPIDAEAITEEYLRCGEILAPFITDSHLLLQKVVKEGHKILFEGAQGTMLDIDHGTYPFVTSSSTTVGGACTGTGLPPKQIHAVLGIAKAYCTRVGEGAFPSEDFGSDGEKMRDAGGEYGATTGRPRRCGWFDAVAMRYSIDVNGMDALALMKIDVLDDFDEIKVCTAYELDGVRINYVPDMRSDYQRCIPIYETVPGWKAKTEGVTKWGDLPEKARSYIEYIESVLDIPVAIVSTGRERSQTLVREEKLGAMLA